MPSTRLAAAGCLLVAVLIHGALAEEAEDGVCKSGSESSCRTEETDDLEGHTVVREIKQACPLFDMYGHTVILPVLRAIAKSTSLLKLLSFWPSKVSTEGWVDPYTTLMYVGASKLMLGLYKARDKSYVNIPTGKNDPDDLAHVENVFVPRTDVDGTPNFFWFEAVAPSFLLNRLYVPLLTCAYSLLRRLGLDSGSVNGTFSDALDDPTVNTWEAAMAGSHYKAKVDWVKAFYETTYTWDGKPTWPTEMTNFQTYFKQDEWDDRLEQAFAFHLIASHRVEAGSWSFDNVAGAEKVELPFRIPLNVFSTLEVRPGFGKYGVDLYFNADGLPVLLVTPTGETVTRGDKNWQYWKFVWRSSVITGITLVDHLHFTHFRVSNLLARSSRVALDAASPLRRFTSIFTFGAIFVNLQAVHTLSGSNQMLHRATPFKDFEKLSRIVPHEDSKLMHDVPDKPGIKELMDDDAWNKLHPKLQQTPFYADGRLLMKIIQKLLQGVKQLTKGLFCNELGFHTETFKTLMTEFVSETNQSHFSVDPNLKDAGKIPCNDMMETIFYRLASYIFTVTGWHRHVGFVGDYYLDPSLATMSWKDGELSGRPRQHIMMTVINVFTSSFQPLLREDYTHLFKGMQPDLENEFTALWRTFQDDLSKLEDEIDKRNKEREIVNINMSPRVLESAVSK